MTRTDPFALTVGERDFLQRAHRWFDDHREAFLDDLAAWVAIPSTSRADEAATGRPYGADVATALEAAAARAVELGLGIQHHDGHALSVLLGDGPDEIGLVSHLDVVPAGENWTFPPFTMVRQGEFVIGRGVSDNKGPALANLYLLRMFRDLAIPLRHTLRAIYGGAEETGMADCDHYVRHAPVPRVSLVTDGRFPVNRAQKGSINLRLSFPAGPDLSTFTAGVAPNAVPASAEIRLAAGAVDPDDIAKLVELAAARITILRDEDGGLRLRGTGKSGHAAFPVGTLSAVAVLLGFLADAGILPAADERLASHLGRVAASPYGEALELDLRDDLSGRLTLNIGLVRPAEGAIEVDLDIRYPVTADLGEIRSRIAEFAESLRGTILSARFAAPFALDGDDGRLGLLQGVYRELTGRTEEPYAMGGFTYSRSLPNAITFGPSFDPPLHAHPEFLPEGHGAAHGPDEYLHLPSLAQAFRIYALSILRLDRD